VNPPDSDRKPETEDRHDAASAGVGGRFIARIFGPWLQDDPALSTHWQHDAHRAYIEQQPLRARSIVYAIVIIFVILVVWAAFAKVHEVTRGTGTVIPSRQVQVIQSQDGGVVAEILVREGDVLKKDQLLVRLDQTRSQSTFGENRAEYQALTVKAARLRALAEKTDFEPDEELAQAVPQIVAEEKALYLSSKEELELDKRIASEQLIQRNNELEEMTARERQLARSLELTRQEYEVTQPMVSSGAVSQVELLRLEKEVNRLEGELDQARAQIRRIRSAIQEAEGKVREAEVEFASTVRKELTDTLTRINALQKVGAGLSDRVKQTSVRSPVNGTVKRLHVNTIGGVVLPGKEIVEVVPLDDTLLLDVRIKPRDIAFLAPGQDALVMVTAYDFVVYGLLEGTVEHIGVDTQMDAEGNPFYPVKVRTKEASLGENMPIIPGMTVQVDILTGKKSILSYLLKPVLRARQVAMTER
jgi:adhesin transport system membrane fusion protein